MTGQGGAGEVKALNDEMDALTAEHDARHHPGRSCLEDADGECSAVTGRPAVWPFFEVADGAR